ncbi:MAG: STAS domain-containing protein [Desulfobacteraceae bacterium]|nr:MAG: STAS domain-containing protein [Desulfobacteraceae bacterium]
MAVKRQISKDGRILTINITGRFDIITYKDFGEAYKDKLDSVSKCVVDMAEVEYVDSSALGMLLMLRERSGGDSAAIDIVNFGPGVKNILKTANFDRLFNIE